MYHSGSIYGPTGPRFGRSEPSIRHLILASTTFPTYIALMRRLLTGFALLVFTLVENDAAAETSKNPLYRLAETPASQLDLGLHRMEHFLGALYEYDNWPEGVRPAFVEFAEDRGLIVVSVDATLRGADATQAEETCQDWFAFIRRRSGVHSDKGTLMRGPSRFAGMFIDIRLTRPLQTKDPTGVDATIQLECSASFDNNSADQIESLNASAPLLGTSYSVEMLR